MSKTDTAASGIKIGLEVHVQLDTVSKLFCGCPTQGTEPNTATCEICLGHPGSKPVLNKLVVEHATRLGLALECEIQQIMAFSRKTYFYPDLAKNFQITQYEKPIACDGVMAIQGSDVRIGRIQIEEDPARLQHPSGSITTSRYVLADYNRSGVPLCEVVTEPDLKSPEHAQQFLSEFLSMLEYLGVYSPERCTLRVDANVSFKGGARVEVKNITGFVNVRKALQYEIIRQRNLARQNHTIVAETRHYDAGTGVTVSLRLKETEEDYGYIFEPDLSVVELKPFIAAAKKEMPELPRERTVRLQKQYKLSETFARVLTQEKGLGDFFESCAKKFKNYTLLSSWIVNELQKCLNYQNVSLSKSKVTNPEFLKFMQKIESTEITERHAKELIKLFVEKGEPIEKLIGSEVIDVAQLVEAVIKENQKAAADFKAGRKESLDFLLGEVLKKAKHAAKPSDVRKLLLDKLE